MISSISALSFKEPTLALPPMPLQEPQETCWWKRNLCSSSKRQVLTHSRLWCRKADRLTYASPCSGVSFGEKKKKKQLKSLERRGPSPQLLPPHHPKGKFAHGEEAQARALPHQFFLHNNRYSFSNFCLFCWFVVFFCFEALGLAEGSPKSDGTEPKVSKTRPNERKACDEGSRPLAPEPSPKGGCSRLPRLANAGSSARRSSLLDSNQPPLN